MTTKTGGNFYGDNMTFRRFERTKVSQALKTNTNKIILIFSVSIHFATIVWDCLSICREAPCMDTCVPFVLSPFENVWFFLMYVFFSVFCFPIKLINLTKLNWFVSWENSLLSILCHWERKASLKCTIHDGPNWTLWPPDGHKIVGNRLDQLSAINT